MIDALTIKSPRAAAAFANLRQRRMLFALMAKDCSLSELTELDGMPLNLLHHHIRKLMRLGLVAVSGSRRRAGAPIKLYRATARTFFVPAELAGPPTTPLHEALRETLERSLARSCAGVRYSHDGGQPRMMLVRTANAATRVSELWLELKLSDADAAALAGDLKSLVKRYAARSTKSRRRYIVHAALAPR